MRTERGFLKRSHAIRPPLVRQDNVVVQKNTRSRSNNKSEITKKVSDWLKRSNSDFYLGFGGVGDALLTLASAYNNSRATIVFFANGGSIGLIQKFFRLYNIPNLVDFNIMGQSVATEIYQMVMSHPNFKMSGHLADRLDYDDWSNEHKYQNRIVSTLAWKEKWGTISTNTNGIICIAPSGSHRDSNRQRFLSVSEYKNLTQKYLDQNCTVYGIGSEGDFQIYGQIHHPNCLWATSDFIITAQGNKQSSNLLNMLKIINSSTEVFSMDTWFKTYTLITGIPTTVIATRWQGKYKQYGEDVTDFIFLNKKIWPKLKIARIEDLMI